MTLSCIPSVIETVLSWTHNRAVVNEDEDTTFSPMNLNHNLILDNTDVDDSGRYICYVELDDEIVEQSINVTVVAGTVRTYVSICTYVHVYVTVLRKTSHVSTHTEICFIAPSLCISTLNNYTCSLPPLANVVFQST